MHEPMFKGPDPELQPFPKRPYPGETLISNDPNLMKRLGEFIWNRLIGQDPKLTTSDDPLIGMIPTTPKGMLQGPTRGLTEAMRGTVREAGQHPASRGGIESKLTKPLAAMPKYSMKQQMGRGDPEAYQEPLSDMNMPAVMRQVGSSTSQYEGRLAETLHTTPRDPVTQIGEIYELLGTILGPIFRTRPVKP